MKNTNYLIQVLDNAIINAKNDASKLDSSILDMWGMSSKKNRHLLNNLLYEGSKYLEVGVCQGSTFVSANFKNSTCLSVGVDDFSEFGNNRVLFLENVKKYLGNNEKNIKFVEKNSWNILKEDLNNEKFNIYFYDGCHSEDDQYKALQYYYDFLEDEFIFIVDDWNNHQPKSLYFTDDKRNDFLNSIQKGTFSAISDLNLKILYKEELFSELTPDSENLWWNGLFLCVLKK